MFFSQNNSNDMFFSNWNKERDEENIYRWTEFFHRLDNRKWKMHTDTRVKKNKSIYLSIYLSIWKPFENGHIYSRIFENTPQNGPEYSHRNLESGHCGEKKHRGLAVLVSLIVKLISWANSPRVGKGPPCQSLEGQGAAKAWYLPLVLLWESQCTGHVCFSLSCQILVTFEAHWPMKAFPLSTC